MSTRSKREHKTAPAPLPRPLSGADDESSARSFSSNDPSPFTQRPTLPTDSSAYRELVAIAAYYRAQRRGFAPGGEVEDWLEAEREVATRISESRAQ
jgi:hypothetical protein